MKAVINSEPNIKGVVYGPIRGGADNQIDVSCSDSEKTHTEPKCVLEVARKIK
jgi:hypothetical protein